MVRSRLSSGVARTTSTVCVDHRDVVSCRAANAGATARRREVRNSEGRGERSSETPITCCAPRCRVWTLGSAFIETETARYKVLTKHQRQHGVLKALSDSARRWPSRRMKWVGRRRRLSFDYRVAGESSCSACFRHVNSISKRNLQTLQGRVSSNRIGVRLHYGNNRRQNASTTARLVAARSFLDKFIDENCVPCPDTTSAVNGLPVMILPLHFSPKVIFAAYRHESGVNGLGRTRFDQEKKSRFKGRVRLEKRKTAYCKVCGPYRDKKRANRNTVEDDADFAAHRDFFTSARKKYNESVREAQRAAQEAAQSGSIRDVSMLSFDYAAPFILPKVNVQVAADYFETMPSVSMFGVVDEGTNRQKTFLFPEGKCPEIDKGGTASAQAVCSLVSHAILSMPTTRHLNLQADNCTSQNKNNYLLKMCMLLIEKGVVESIDLRFMAVGHTKFSPDRHFGSIKTAAKPKLISSFDELVSHVEDNRYCEAVTAFNWLAFKPFLTSLIREVFPAVKSFYQFEIRRGFKVTAFKDYPMPGPGSCEQRRSTPRTKTFVTRAADAESMRQGLLWPPVMPPAGLSADRRRALLRDIAPIYPGRFQKFVEDLVRECDGFQSAVDCPEAAAELPVNSCTTNDGHMPQSSTSMEPSLQVASNGSEVGRAEQCPMVRANVEVPSSPPRARVLSREPVWCSVCQKTLSCRRNYNVHVKIRLHINGKCRYSSHF